jgi:hypothetical protein
MSSFPLAPPVPDSVILRVSTRDEGLPMMSEARPSSVAGSLVVAYAVCGIGVGPVLGSARLREVSWSRSNSFWGTSRFKRLNVTLAASSGFDRP